MVLDVPISFTKKLLENSSNEESYKRGAKKDQHEDDLEFQKKVHLEYERNLSKSGWEKIDCVEDEKLLSIEEIHERVYNKVKKVLEEDN